MSDSTVLELTADIVSAHLSNNAVAAAEVPDLIRTVFDALSRTEQPLVADAPRPEPAVSVRASIRPDYLVCLEDGAKLKMLKRYLRTRFDLSPEEYRRKWGLPADYPMVAPNYAETRRSLAHKIGLGRKTGQAAGSDATTGDAGAKPARKRLGIAAAKQAAQQHLGAADADTPAKTGAA